MTYTFNFATRAQYVSAKASGGVIYAALMPSTSATTRYPDNNSGTVKTNVSRSVTSFIAETGEAVVDSVNLCVPYDKGGFPGDVLCYNSSIGYFWMKDPKASFSGSYIGQNYYDSATWPSGFVRVGFCFWRIGKRGLVAAINDLNSGSGVAWSTDTSTALNIHTTTSCSNGTRATAPYAGNLDVAEHYWNKQIYYPSWPIPRYAWDQIVADCKDGKTYSSAKVASDYGCTINSGSISVTMTSGVATITAQMADGTKSFNPADYDYDFDKWYSRSVNLLIPGAKGTLSGTFDSSGRRNDGVHITKVMADTGNSPAATQALAWAVSAPDFGAKRWWIPTSIELHRLAGIKTHLNNNGMGFKAAAYWCCDQYSGSDSWLLYTYGAWGPYTKSDTGRVRVVAAFNI